MKPVHPWCAAFCEAVGTLEGCWGGGSTVSPYADLIGPRHSWGAPTCEIATTVEGCWGCHHSVAIRG
eukprot:1082807-Pyramimonas_sp.AAC.1